MKYFEAIKSKPRRKISPVGGFKLPMRGKYVFLAVLIIFSFYMIAPSAIFLLAQDSTNFTTDATRDDTVKVDSSTATSVDSRSSVVIQEPSSSTQASNSTTPDSSNSNTSSGNYTEPASKPAGEAYVKEPGADYTKEEPGADLYTGTDEHTYSNDAGIYDDYKTGDTTGDVYYEKEPIIYEAPKVYEPAYVEVKTDYSPADEVLPECKKYGIYDKEKCQHFMEVSPICRDRGIIDWEECNNYMLLSYECRDRGILDRGKCMEYMAFPKECRDKGIREEVECKRYLSSYYMPTECQRAGISSERECSEFFEKQARITYECRGRGITDVSECDKFMMEKRLPQECQDNGINDWEECDYFMRNKPKDYTFDERSFEEEVKVDYYYEAAEGTPEECVKVGVIDQKECEKIMFAIHLPSECKDAGATTKEACDKVMYIERMPPECQEAGISDREDCDKHLRLVHMPPECQEAGVTSEEECEKILFKQHAPSQCIEAGIYNPKDCERHMFKQHVPAGCKEAGIQTEEACKKFMFEKYGAKDKIPTEELPIECQKARATNFQECGQVMRKAYMPQECLDHGLETEDECERYFQKKYTPPECQAAGAYTRAECDKVMFKKFSPFECLDAGINNNEDCEKYIFNKYSPKVECRGLDEFQCKNAIKDRHLGNIVAKQVKFNEIKDNVLGLAGESLRLGKLEENLNLAKDIMPLIRKDIGVKVLAATELLVLDEAENLIQTAPVALMIDSDEDGLPDDIEARLGTNPNNKDSDGDGYSDGDEFKNGYNPLGDGKLKEALAPIDKAIIENKTLGHPKLEGEESKELSIKNIINITGQFGEHEGYNISGQATPDSVATLYIYSDLPLVVTVSTDEYGNWKYNFKESLVEGEHEVYVAINDNTGRVIKKSSPMSFFIKEAKAVSINDFIAADIELEQGKQRMNFLLYYFATGFVIILGIVIYYLLIKEKIKIRNS